MRSLPYINDSNSFSKECQKVQNSVTSPTFSPNELGLRFQVKKYPNYENPIFKLHVNNSKCLKDELCSMDFRHSISVWFPNGSIFAHIRVPEI